MKHVSIMLVSFFLLGSVFAVDYTGLRNGRELSQENIIVDYSVISGDSELQEASLYKLSNTLIRQEGVGIALKLRNITLPDGYQCNNYFLDTSEGWVCRAAELAADNYLITRVNTSFRPHDALTVAEALGIAMKTLDISLSTTDTSSIKSDISAWQKRLLLTLAENNITLSAGTKIDANFDLSKNITRGQFFEIIVALMQFQKTEDPTAHCLTYTDGCNECDATSGEAMCTERACIWQGIPACYTCEEGYSLENNRCVPTTNTCVKEGGYAGGGHVIGPEDPADFLCCSGLTRAERNDGTTFADAGYTCIREGDGICDTEYEGTDNSADCREVAAFNPSICQSYFDGCNNCSNLSDGNTACTKMACLVTRPAYCTSYVTYTPQTQTADTLFLSSIVQEMQNYTQDLSCSDSDQCRWSMTGTKACGGPSMAIPYSTKNVDETLVENKAKYITDIEKIFNTQYGIMSDCMLIVDPAPMSCINNLCQ